MPILNIQYRDENPKVAPELVLAEVGPTIQVLVGPAPPTEDNGRVHFKGEETAALIDTGATSSCIDEKLARKLGLTPIDRQEIGGIKGKKEHIIYLGMIYVPPPLKKHRKGPFIGVNMEGRQPVLLGRDFLRGCILIYNGTNGTISISV